MQSFNDSQIDFLVSKIMNTRNTSMIESLLVLDFTLFGLAENTLVAKTPLTDSLYSVVWILPCEALQPRS